MYRFVCHKFLIFIYLGNYLREGIIMGIIKQEHIKQKETVGMIFGSLGVGRSMKDLQKEVKEEHEREMANESEQKCSDDYDESDDYREKEDARIEEARCNFEDSNNERHAEGF